MHFSIEEQSFTDTETGVRYTFGVNRADTALVTITAGYPDGHKRVWTYGRNAGLKSEETFPAVGKTAVAVPVEARKADDPVEHEPKGKHAGRITTSRSLGN